MLLESLRILNKDGVIRDIPFRMQGLNLVVDVTPMLDGNTASGNNVGKTTFIRSIDFCLGASGKDIYKDKETRSDNSAVKSFLMDTEVVFILTIIDRNAERFILQRSFIKDYDLFINGTQYDNLKIYNSRLNNILFYASDNGAVSFRSFIKKFIRSDSFSEGNMYKILHSTTKDHVYEALYLYLFGFPDVDLIARRLQLIDEIQKQKKRLKSVSGVSTLPKLQSRLTQIQKNIDDKEAHVKLFDLPKTYNDLLSRLQTLKGRTADLSSRVGAINTKIALSNRSLVELHDSQANIDPTAIRQLYDDAKHLIPNLQTSFEQVFDFHNKMISNKERFVQAHIRQLESERAVLQSELETDLRQQAHILRSLDDTGTFDDLVKIREELNFLYVERGKIDFQIETIKEIQKTIDGHTVLLIDANETFDVLLEDFNNNLQNIFNEYFKEYTRLTHGQQLYIYYDHVKGKFEFDNIEGNVGDGYKKTEVIAFDLAFIKYFETLGLNFPRFVVHDKLEIVHKNQLQIIFSIADSIPGQFVVSVLKERISFLGESYIQERSILELSEDNKFFSF